MIGFGSDYLEGCIPEILKRLKETNMEQTPGYGVDPHCENAKRLIRDICKAPQADIHFLVGGTQTNATVISSVLLPFQGVICADSGHINVHETGAIEHGGHKTLSLPSTDGKIKASQIEKVFKDHDSDSDKEHTVQPGLIYISYPTELGTLYSKEELQDIYTVAHNWGAKVFIDGARLGYGLTSDKCDIEVSDLVHLSDVFYLGGTKQGALFGEAVVFANKQICPNFRYYIKQNGGMLAKGRLLGIQYEVLFENGLYFTAARKANILAKQIKEALQAKGVQFLVDSPTNQLFPILSDKVIEELSEKFSFSKWVKVDAEHTAVRFCTSWATTPENVDALIKAIQAF